MKIAPGTLHKYLTGETVTGDDASIATNINKVFDAITTAHNDTDDKLTADVSNLAANYYTKPQTDTALGVRDTNLNNYKTETATNFGIRDSAIAQLSLGQIPPAPNTLPIPVSLGNGLQVVNVGVGSPYNVLNIIGRTLINLLGRDGNCEDTTKWTPYGSGSSILDTTNKTIGSNGFKILNGASNAGVTKTAFRTFTNGSKYVLVADIKHGTGIDTDVEIKQNSGATISASCVSSDATKFNTTYSRFTGDGTPANINLYVNGGVNTYGYVDAIRIYEISTSDYNAIAGMTAAQVAAKYPYVDDVKHVNAPYVIKYGENLLPTLNEYNLNAGSPTVISPYSGSVTTNDKFIIQIPVVAGQSYSISATSSDTNGRLFVTEVGGATKVDISGISLLKSENFTIAAGITQLEIRLLGLSATATTITNPMLNLGATAKPFKPRNDDTLFFPNVQLASSVDGTVYDQLFKKDGKFWRENRFARDMVLDGSLTWSFNIDYAGFKQVKVTGLPASLSSLSTSAVSVKYDGKILGYGSGASDSIAGEAGGLSIYFTIADTDSGWGETYTPTAQEIQAYFYGYVMYLTAPGTPYNGTGTKSFGKRTSGGSVLWVQDTNAPTVPATAYGGVWNNYKLTYQLATATFEEIQVDAGMSLHEGLNQLEVGQAVQVREKVTPLSVGGNYLINHTATTSSAWLKNRTNRIVKVFKNGIDNAKAVIASSNAGAVGGGAFAYILPADFDPTATYEVVYIASDQYLLSAPVQTVNGEVASNLKTVVDALSMNDADQDARIAANELLARQIYNVPQKTLANMTLYVDATNGADNNDGSAGKPFKTIGRAVNSVPQMANNQTIIYVASGTYAEDVTITNFTGQLSILATNTAQNATNVNSIAFTHCKGRFQALGFTSTTTTKDSFMALYCDAVIFDTCWATGASGWAGFVYTTSIGRIQSGIASNKLYGILASSYSHIAVAQVNGTGNTNAVLSDYGSVLGIHSLPIPTGTVPTATQNGGMIISSGGVVNPWGDNTAANRSRVFVANNATQSINAATATKVLYQQETTDNLAENDSSISRFTAKNAGTYLVSGSLSFSSGMGTAVGCTIIVYKNGAAFRTTKADNGSSSASPMLNFVQQIDLVAGDYIEVYINTSGATVVATNTTLDITRIA